MVDELREIREPGWYPAVVDERLIALRQPTAERADRLVAELSRGQRREHPERSVSPDGDLIASGRTSSVVL